MTISSLALAAKKVIDAAWLHGDAYDLSSQAAFALESTQLLQSPETAAQFERLRTQVAELTAQRVALAERLRAGQRWQRGRNPELVSENYVSQSELREIFAIRLTPPWEDVAEDATGPKLAFTPAETDEYDLPPRVQSLRDLLAGQREQTGGA